MHRESGGETFRARRWRRSALGRNAQSGADSSTALVDWAPLAAIVSVVYAAPRRRTNGGGDGGRGRRC